MYYSCSGCEAASGISPLVEAFASLLVGNRGGEGASEKLQIREPPGRGAWAALRLGGMAGHRRRLCSVIAIIMASAGSGRRIHGNSISMHHFKQVVEDKAYLRSKQKPKPKAAEDPLCAIERRGLRGKWKKISRLVFEVSAPACLIRLCARLIARRPCNSSRLPTAVRAAPSELPASRPSMQRVTICLSTL